MRSFSSPGARPSRDSHAPLTSRSERGVISSTPPMSNTTASIVMTVMLTYPLGARQRVNDVLIHRDVNRYSKPPCLNPSAAWRQADVSRVSRHFPLGRRCGNSGRPAGRPALRPSTGKPCASGKFRARGERGIYLMRGIYPLTGRTRLGQPRSRPDVSPGAAGPPLRDRPPCRRLRVRARRARLRAAHRAARAPLPHPEPPVGHRLRRLDAGPHPPRGHPAGAGRSSSTPTARWKPVAPTADRCCATMPRRRAGQPDTEIPAGLPDHSPSSSRTGAPYLASLASPTPLIPASSAREEGEATAIARSVASWNTT